jgi:hypothetical protein
MPAWTLLLTGCVWVPSSELDLRWAELIDADEDGHDDVAYGGEDCDDGDPSVHPGTVETLGDAVDSDCDGEPDGSPWATVDLRGSTGVRGPRLGLGEHSILLAWQAETIEGDTTLHDGFGLLALDLADPTGPELGARLEGSAEDLGTSGPFDMDVEGGIVVLAQSTWTEEERLIGVHGLPEDLSSHHGVSTEPFAGLPFDALQLGVSESDYAMATACGPDGAGIHGVAVWADDLASSGAALDIDSPLVGEEHDHSTCEVAPISMTAYTNHRTEGQDLDIYGFDQSAGTFAYVGAQLGSYAWVDFEITDEHGYSLQAFVDEQTNRVLVMDIGPSLSTTQVQSWIRLPAASIDADAAPSGAGHAYACVVDVGGGVTVYQADLWEQGHGAPIQALEPVQHTLGELQECAVVVTAEDLLVLAVRSDEGIHLSRFRSVATGD